jgi:hypothetical protein
MRFVAVATLRDRGAVEVAREVLEASGIEVEVRTAPINPYFGAPTAEEIEVRVPEDRVKDAYTVLDRLEGEVDAAAAAESEAPTHETGDEIDVNAPRPRKISWALAIALISPLPGLPMGMLYARGPSWLAFTLFGLAIADIALVGFNFPAFVAIKLIDAALAPVFAARFNRKLAERPHAHS